MAGGECRPTTATRSVTGTYTTKVRRMRCDTPPGHLVNSVTVAWKRQHASFHRAPLSGQGLPRLKTLQFNFHTTGRPCTDAADSLLPSGCGFSLCQSGQHFSLSSLMVDQLISWVMLLLLLLPLKAINAVYNSINTTLAALSQLSALHKLCPSTRSYSDERQRPQQECNEHTMAFLCGAKSTTKMIGPKLAIISVLSHC